MDLGFLYRYNSSFCLLLQLIRTFALLVICYISSTLTLVCYGIVLYCFVWDLFDDTVAARCRGTSESIKVIHIYSQLLHKASVLLRVYLAN